MSGLVDEHAMEAELDDLIRSEQKLLALQHHGEAWAGSFYEGVDHDILAETALLTAFQEIIRVEGEEGALQRLDSLRDRILSGDFQLDLTRH